MTKRGLYIVIEGPEGVGKTVQVELLEASLKAQGRTVRIAREPDSQTDLTARSIRHLTQDPRYPMNTKTEVLLYNAARSQSLEVVRRSINAGMDCIVDRSFLTTLAIQYYGRGDVTDYDVINNIIRFAVGDMYPDVLLILDAPVEVLRSRMKDRYHGERFDNLDLEFLSRVRNGYLKEAELRAIPIIDSTQDIKLVGQEILTHITYARQATTDKPVKEVPKPTENVSQTQSSTPRTEEPVIKSSVSFIAAVQSLSGTNTIPVKPQASKGGSFLYYRPENFGKKVLGAYDTIIKKLLENHELTVKGYSKYLATQAIRNKKPFSIDKLKTKSIDQCRGLLPVCTLLDIETDHKPSELSEETTKNALADLFPHIDSEPSKSEIKLLSHTPRNEFEILESLIFANSDQSTTSISRLVDELTYEKKSELFKTCLGEESKLQDITYTFNVACEFGQLFDLLSASGGNAVMQDLTPRNGYDVPQEVESAGLGELYQQSFDLSLELYSLLQSAGFESQAQYAALLGHRMRAKLTFNYEQIKKLIVSSKNQSSKTLIKDIKQQVLGVHPLVWSK